MGLIHFWLKPEMGLILFFATATQARPTRARFQPEQDISPVSPPRGWSRTDTSLAPRDVEIIIAIRQQNVDLLEDALTFASDPDSHRYGQWLSHSDVNELLAPRHISVRAVEEWIAAHSAAATLDFTPNRDFCIVRLPVTAAEQMLETK